MLEKISGYVMLVGNGAVGKTTVSKMLALTNITGENPDSLLNYLADPHILSKMRSTSKFLKDVPIKDR